MRARLRVTISIVVIGLALVTASQLNAGFASTSSITPGTFAPEIYLLYPARASISISVLNGSALLVVAPLDDNISTGPPIVNVSVSHRDTVIFSVRNRGYYSIKFETTSGTVPEVTYTIAENGAPADLILYGGILAVIGVASTVFEIILERLRGRDTRAPCSAHLERQVHDKLAFHLG